MHKLPGGPPAALMKPSRGWIPSASAPRENEAFEGLDTLRLGSAPKEHRESSACSAHETFEGLDTLAHCHAVVQPLPPASSPQAYRLSGVNVSQSLPKDSPKPPKVPPKSPQSLPKASPKLPQSFPKASPKSPKACPDYPSLTKRLPRASPSPKTEKVDKESSGVRSQFAAASAR